MPAVARRLVTVPAFLTLAVLTLGSAPLWLPALALFDLARGRNFTGLRCAAFFAWFFALEAAGIAAAFGVWLLDGPWRGGPAERYRERNHRLEWWWAGALYHGAKRIFGFSLALEGEDALPGTPLLLFLRHVSLADTVLPAVFVSEAHDVRLRYVMKRELLWDPCIDIIGNRLPNHFVDRDPDDSASEIAAVARLADGLGPGEGALIYPEGTRFSQAKRARVLERLRARGQHEAADRAERLKHVLPPRPGGPLALMARAPEADVVFCAHTGFEGAGTFGDLWRGSLVGARVRVRFWRVPAARIPRDPDDRREWLFDQWATLDRWLASVAGS